MCIPKNKVSEYRYRLYRYSEILFLWTILAVSIVELLFFSFIKDFEIYLNLFPNFCANIVGFIINLDISLRLA